MKYKVYVRINLHDSEELLLNVSNIRVTEELVYFVQESGVVVYVLANILGWRRVGS
jgi:hypothetical protein